MRGRLAMKFVDAWFGDWKTVDPIRTQVSLSGLTALLVRMALARPTCLSPSSDLSTDVQRVLVEPLPRSSEPKVRRWLEDLVGHGPRTREQA
jgi:hypothetical protein